MLSQWGISPSDKKVNNRNIMFQQCLNTTWASSVSHIIDIVPSCRHRFVYVDNVKAASSTIRASLKRYMPKDADHWDQNPERYTGRLKTNSLPWTSSSDAYPTPTNVTPFVWSLVREPIEKFESGVRQARWQNKRLENLTSDEMLYLQLKKSKEGSFINEHLMPSTWRLTGRDKNDKIVNMDFIGAIETIDVDFPYAASNFHDITPAQYKGFSTKQNKIIQKKPDPRDKLSKEAIRAMYASDVYHDEWRCFGYPLPEEVKEMDS